MESRSPHVSSNRRLGIELKREDAPRLTRSMQTAARDLDLDGLLVVYPGSRRYALAENIRAVPLSADVLTAR